MIADGSIDELRFVGMTAESISTGVNGLVTEVGYLRNIDTSGTPYSQTWAAGDIIYVSATAAGGLTNVQPVAPNLKIVVALVINADNNFGVLLVRPTVYPQINDLSNVNISTVTGGDLLVYDGTDARWENAAQSTITAGKATNLAGGAAGSLPYQSAADTTTFLAAGSDGQVLKLASGVPTWSSDASGVTITDDTTTNATRYLTFTDATTGTETGLDVSSTKLTYNPSTGVLASTTFSGSGTSLTGVGLLATAGTYTALQTFSGSSSVAAIKVPNIKEVATVSATAATGTINYDITTQSVLYYTTDASANWTLNVRGSSGTSLDTIMSTGETMTAVFMVTQGATAYYNSAFQIDGNAVTPKWLGGAAPTEGTASGVDVYTYAIVKTGSATFTVFASVVAFA
jgi:hypothetical protein